jgi:type IV pilus assembly protein PilB
MAIARKGLLEILEEKQLITAEQKSQAEAALRTAPGTDPVQYLINNNLATDVDAYRAKAEAEGLHFVDLTKHKPEASALNVVPQNVVSRYNALPVRKDGPKLWVAMSNPRDINAIDDIRRASRCTQIIPLVATPADLEAEIKKAYGALAPAAASPGNPSAMVPAANAGGGAADTSKLLAELKMGNVNGGDDDGVVDEDLINQAPIVRLANAIIVNAIESRASDIHIEPDKRNVRVRCRIDGVLQEVMSVPKFIQPALCSRYKIMADMNIAERRVPQDGRIPIKHNNKDYDMRVNCLPSLYGEKIVMRILDKSSVLIGLNNLGFYPEYQSVLEDMVAQPNGMFLVTGPTGSGKTTTLYSVLNKLNDIEKNITTAEDPIEYQLSGITQVGMNRKAGLTFATALRAYLRQDPDIIMVGEMRDLETAEIAIEAALTGHLVLSTLHTNDAPSATMRLADMGVEPFLISATVIGILAQRLTRKICNDCKEPYQVKATELARFGFVVEDPDQEVSLFRGRGCETCKGKGYRGRMGVYELLKMNSEIAELVVRRAPLADIKEAARANGMKELKEDGLRKILDGHTTPEEVRRVVFTAGA